MGSFHEAGQFIRRNHRDFFFSLAHNDNDFAIIRHTVKHRSEALAQVRICSFGHTIRVPEVHCTASLYMGCAPVSPGELKPYSPACKYLHLPYNAGVPKTAAARLDRVLAQLRLYEHPLLDFSARAKGEGVEVVIQFRDQTVPVHTYYFDLHPRDLDHSQFEWSFQRQLYDALHDYFVEMFIRTPQDLADRREKGL